MPSSGGVFEVTVDGKLIFSKKALRRHAEPGEVVQLIPRLELTCASPSPPAAATPPG